MRLRPVFTIEKTKGLVDRGFKCYGAEINRDDPTKLVFLFERNKEVEEALAELLEIERANKQARKKK